MEIIVKQSFSHINRSFSGWDTPKGRWIRSEGHYKELCKQQNMIPYEQAQELAQKNVKGKEYKLSTAANKLIQEAKKFKGAKGEFQSSRCPQLIDKMITAKIVKPKDYGIEHLPAHLQRSF